MRSSRISNKRVKQGRGIIARHNIRRGEVVFRFVVQLFSDPPKRKASQCHCQNDHDAISCGDQWVLLRNHTGQVQCPAYYMNSSWRGPGLARRQGNIEMELEGSVLLGRARVRIQEATELLWGYQWWDN